MTTAINGYVLNEVNEPADWSQVERNLLETIIDKLPDAGALVTPTSRHSHSVLVASDGSPDPVISVSALGAINIYYPTYHRDQLSYFGLNSEMFIGVQSGEYVIKTGQANVNMRIEALTTGSDLEISSYNKMTIECTQDDIVLKPVLDGNVEIEDGRHLQLGNEFDTNIPTAAGYVTVKDNQGDTIYLLATKIQP